MMLLRIIFFSCCLLVYAGARRHGCHSRHHGHDPRCPRYPKCLQCPPPWPKKAVCVLPHGPVTGIIRFEQHYGDKCVTVVTGHIKGLSEGRHGIHVHEFGDLTKGCASTGGHYNPFNKEHGGPEDKERHVGDLGNIKADEHGMAHINKTINMLSLCGPHSIMGRSFMVHEKADDLGKGGNPDSKKTGNAGARLACCVIGRAQHY